MRFRPARGIGQRYMSERAFFDTNVLLYLYDRRDVFKRQRAAETFRAALESRTLVISTQVVQEFYASATRKLGLASREAEALVLDLCQLPLWTVEAAEIQHAIRLESQFRLAFWDALILAAAEAAGATILFTEGFSHGRAYGPVHAVNPFLNPA